MKSIVLILAAAITFWACSENSTGNNNKNGGTESFVSQNVKDGTTYFNFSTNNGDTSAPASWDISFASIPYVQFIGCQTMAIQEPLIILGDGTTAARVAAASLDEVTEIPVSGFEMDAPEEEPFIGETWVNQSFLPTNEVYAIKTCAGNYAIVQFADYVYTGAPLHQVEDIKFKVKFNSDGSNDFTSTMPDSFEAPNAYTNKQYYSFLNGIAMENEQSDITVDGYSIWLKIGTSVKMLNTTDFESVTTVSDDNWEADKGPEYVTLSWYNYSGPPNHVLTPKEYVYVVRNADDSYAAFKIMNYYDDMGESGVFTIDWKYLD